MPSGRALGVGGRRLTSGHNEDNDEHEANPARRCVAIQVSVVVVGACTVERLSTVADIKMGSGLLWSSPEAIVRSEKDEMGGAKKREKLGRLCRELAAVYMALVCAVRVSISRDEGAARKSRSEEGRWAEAARGVGGVPPGCCPHIRSSGGRRGKMGWGAGQGVSVVLKIDPGMLARLSHAVNRCRCFVLYLVNLPPCYAQKCQRMSLKR